MSAIALGPGVGALGAGGLGADGIGPGLAQGRPLGRTLALYLVGQTALSVAGALGLVFGLLWIGEVFEAWRAARPDASVATIVWLATLKTPQTLMDTMGLALLIGVLSAFRQLGLRGETTAALAAGFSPTALILPAVLFAALFGVAKAAVFSPVAAWGARAYADAEPQIINRTQSSDVWLRLPLNDGRAVTLKAAGAALEPSGAERQVALKDVLVLVSDPQGRLDTRYDAPEGMLAGGALTLRRAQRLDLDTSVPVGMREAVLPITSPIEAIVTGLNERRRFYGLWELPRAIEDQAALGAPTWQLEQRMHRLLVEPVLFAGLALLAAALAFRTTARAVDPAALSRAVVALGFVFLLVRIGQELGQSGAVAPWLAAWTPALACLMVGLAALVYREG